jgi:hypothetical protein
MYRRGLPNPEVAKGARDISEIDARIRSFVVLHFGFCKLSCLIATPFGECKSVDVLALSFKQFTMSVIRNW